MDKVTSYLEIQQLFKAIKEVNKGYITNLYAEIDKVNAWIGNGQFRIKVIGDTVFFFNDKTTFSNLFFCSSSIEALSKSLALLRSQIGDTLIAVDLIGKEPEIQSIVQAFSKNGFYEYTTLNRMSRNTPTEGLVKSNQDLSKPEIKHSKKIFDLLNTYFDPLAEQLPTENEISNWINENHLILIEEKSDVLGFVIFDLIGVTSYLRYWFVHPQFRNQKLGSILLKEYFKQSVKTKRQLFWVIKSNENAISRYLHYGFHPENLSDYIMTNKNIHYEEKNN